MVNSSVVAAIHVAGVRCDPCGAMRTTRITTHRVTKCVCVA
jgi:hypothetical protein